LPLPAGLLYPAHHHYYHMSVAGFHLSLNGRQAVKLER
jgi:hypothetical protein